MKLRVTEQLNLQQRQADSFCELRVSSKTLIFVFCIPETFSFMMMVCVKSQLKRNC